MQTSTTSKINNTLSHQTESDTIFYYSSDFLEWLRTEEISLAISTYQTNKLFLIGRDTTKHLFVSEKSFDRAMGLHVESENSFYLSTRFLLWRFENALAEGQIHKEADKVYIPRQAFNTGDLNVHDVSVDENGETVFVNTRYNCIAKVSEKYNFKPIWMPPFITKMVAEDRCHLNGMAMRDGKPRYVTAISQSNLLDSWREHRQDGGVVMDMETSEVLADGLSMPHSPRYYQDKIWVLNAGRGEFGYVENNKFIAITQLDGFLRGLAFHKNYAIIGLSKPRHERTFTGLPLDEILQSRNTKPQCGFCIVDINTGKIVHKFEIKGKVVELYDIQVLPSTKRPMTLDLTSDEITRYISIEKENDIVDFKALVALDDEKSNESSNFSYFTPKNTSERKANETHYAKEPNISNPDLSATSINSIEYQMASNITTKQAVQQFNNLSFPRLSLQVQARQFNEPLIVIVAKNTQHYVGALFIELHPNKVGKILSWFVLPPFRGLGIGKELFTRAEKLLRRNKFNSVHLEYRSDWKSISTFEGILERNKWEKPKPKLYLCKSSIDIISKAPWMKKLSLPQDIELYLWKYTTQEEKNKILQRKQSNNWYPDHLSPFQHENNMDLTTSVGLKFNGEIIGWMITHRLRDDTVEFTAAFVDQNAAGGGLRKQSLFLPVLASSLQYLRADGAKYGIWQMQIDNPSIQKFTEKFLKPYLISFVESKFSYKVL
ncbi:TIGR03032 family protein [Bernardetia litoralis DSM 6794]|uniref:TIGR03032 family protein n=1 Tax=Bernardetia litoralis (strain ATCC 23117 / DSM 6794 / NBRC 15988 / NCIMB 1366 / Fx l1 / Sio-4) TaxID=880071 RepID=I4AKM4_BERLS|nr:TIGR03032 family protein [Bernardetia litoralis]AFM04509.1 TIGR03032 family protein [Bernardetia litoralis DSM 6794]